METCFDWTKCQREPKVYVYPNPEDSFLWPAYAKILRVIRESALYTENATEACLFVLSVDPTDRDRLRYSINSPPPLSSENYVKDLPDLISALDQKIWNGGRNHIIFNLYYGTFPDYSQKDLGFDPGFAIMAWASANENVRCFVQLTSL